MNKKYKAAAAEMNRLKDDFLNRRASKSISVHKNLIYRALDLLNDVKPETRDFFSNFITIMIGEVCCPDSAGDYEKGAGRHYYCAADFHGRKKHPRAGYFRNGTGRFAKSARTMLEEDYTMALTMEMAGFKEPAAGFLARAIHMVSDICCLPHATGMTYFSPMGVVHKAYEDLARAMYPDALPSQNVTLSQLRIFNTSYGFGDALNEIASAQINEREQILTDPVSAITHRLYIAEKVVAAMLLAYYDDVNGINPEPRYIAENAVISDYGITLRVTEKGIILIRNGKEIECRVRKETGTLFRAAHRCNGGFTFSPVISEKGRVLVLPGGKLRNFNPCRRNQSYMVSKLID